MDPKVMFASKCQEWETPPEVFNPLNEEFNFDLDVCASANNSKCMIYLSPSSDGLRTHWYTAGARRCWMNPPYSRYMHKWVEKAYIESLMGCTVVCLVFARTDTKWWHEYAMLADEIRFIKGRVKFLGNGVLNSAPAPSCILIFKGRGSIDPPQIRYPRIRSWVLPKQSVRAKAL